MIESDHTFVRPENPRQFVKGFAGKWRGIRGERDKLIFVPRDERGATGDVELYDIQADPREERNISRERPDAAKAMMERLRAWWAATSTADAGAPDEAPPDVEVLRSLGYAGGP